MAGYPWQQQQQTQQPSPYATMQPSSAGNPASSYQSQGGAQAGAWGQPAPSQQPPRAYTPTGAQPSSYHPPTQQAQQQAFQWPAPSPQAQSYQAPQQPAQAYRPPPQAPSPMATFQAPYQQAQGSAQSAQSYQQVVSAYQQILGRTPSAAEVQTPLSQGHSAAEIIQGIQHSPEARQRQQQMAQAQAQAPYPGGAQGGDYNAWLRQVLQPYQGGGVVGPQNPTGPQGVFPGGQPPPQGANTDGYPVPRLTQVPHANAMPGWSNAKWNDPNHQTPKYVVGRILQGIPPRTDQMDIAVARIAAAYPGTRRVGAGDISIPGVGTVDILQSAGAGGRAWQFGGGPGPSAAPQAAAGAPGGDPFSQLVSMLMGTTPPPGYQALAQQAAPKPAAAPAVDPKKAAADKAAADAAERAKTLSDQRAATAAAEAAAAAKQQGTGPHPSFAYY